MRRNRLLRPLTLLTIMFILAVGAFANSKKSDAQSIAVGASPQTTASLI